MAAPIVVHPPLPSGGRRVTTLDGQSLGLAHGTADVLEFLRRAGLDETTVSLDDENLIEWRGGSSEVWA